MEKQKNPGPGNYEPKTIIGRDGPQKTMSPKLEDRMVAKRAYLPGPGAYTSQNFHLRTAPAFGMGSEQRSSYKKVDLKNYIPDGGAYNPKTSFTASASAAWGFGTQIRKNFDDKKAKAVPGPG